LINETFEVSGLARGISNVADLILTRGSGIFVDFNDPAEVEKLKHVSVCQKHLEDFGNNKLFVRNVLKTRGDCRFPQIPSMTVHAKPVAVRRNTFITREDSQIILSKTGFLIPTGMGKFANITVHS